MTTTTDPPDVVIQSYTANLPGLPALSTGNHTISWPASFPDSSYWVSAIQFDGNDSELDSILVRGVKSVTASDVTIRVTNTNVGNIGTNVMLIGIWRPS